MSKNLISFLKDELNLSSDQIKLALNKVQQFPNQLPIALLQYGLINLGQLDKIFDWLETAWFCLDSQKTWKKRRGLID